MKRSSLVSVLALTLLGTAGLVFASTTTNTPGATCVAASGSLVNNAEGQATNITTSSATAVCPIDRQIAPTLSTKVAATVWVIDQSSSSNICCTLHSKNPAGGEQTSPQVCSTGASSSYQPIPLAQITDGATFSHYFVSCNVPGTSGGLVSKILTYRSIED